MVKEVNYGVVCFGEVLWDILPSGPLPGGAPMNVAFHLKKLGYHPALITRIGADDYGQKLANIMAQNGVTTEYFQVDTRQATGLVYATASASGEVVYDIVNPSAWDFIEWSDTHPDVVQQAAYFVFGSLASRNQPSRDTLFRLLEMANKKVLDINLRPPHFTRKGVEALLHKADVLKMNGSELEIIAGWFGDHSQPDERVALLQERFQIPEIIVTMGGDGALVNHDGNVQRHPGFKVHVEDTIGSGDAFLAGYIAQSLKGAPVEKALEFASGMGAFVATQRGACPSYKTSEVDDLVNKSSVV